MKNVDLEQECNNANTMLSAVVVHAHPIVEMQIKNLKKMNLDISLNVFCTIKNLKK